MNSTYEICKWIREAILTHAGEVICYGSWSPDFAAQNIRELPEKLKKAEGFRLVDPSDLSESEMSDLGFGRWSEDNPIRLIPIWLKPFLAGRIKAGDINSADQQEIETASMDDDHRMGYLAYGVLPRA